MHDQLQANQVAVRRFPEEFPRCGDPSVADQLQASAAFVLALADPAASLELVGGKGASLARLARGGFNVPRGFHLTTAAYSAFFEAKALQAPTLEAVALQAAEQARPLIE